METRVMKDQALPLEKQIGGCMAGFFNIFERPHLLSPKCFALPKRLSSSSSSSSPLTLNTAESEPSCSPLDSGIQKQQSVYSTPELRSPAPDQNLSRSPLTIPVIEFKQGSPRSPWRFSKEAPRLSLDSRAVVDAKGSLKPTQIRTEGGSPSVIARLMGLEALPTPDSQQPLQRSASESRVSRDYRFADNFHFQNPQLRRDEKRVEEDPAEFQVRSGRAQPARAPPPQRHVVRRKSFFDTADFFPEPRVTKMSKFDAPPSDLETLKQLLEALRLKGLLHKPQSGIGNRNLVHESPIKPARCTFGIRSGAGVSPSASPRRDRGSKGRTSENSLKSRDWRPSQRRVSSPHPWRRPEPVQTTQEMWKMDEYNSNRRGKTLLERCDKLLNSIAEMAAAGEAGDSQPSPVSVLDASLYHEESSPSPLMKRSLDFTESEDDSWCGSMVSASVSVSPSSDSEYVYISDILRASDCIPQESEIFSLLEKQQYRILSAQERRLIFDAVQEIVGRRRRLPPWRMVGEPDKMEAIWSEYQKMTRKRSSAEEEEDLVGYVCGVLGRDLSEDRWRDCQVDMSEAVLDIERLVFKDLIGETIRHLAALNRSHSDLLRRRLLF